MCLILLTVRKWVKIFFFIGLLWPHILCVEKNWSERFSPLCVEKNWSERFSPLCVEKNWSERFSTVCVEKNWRVVYGVSACAEKWDVVITPMSTALYLGIGVFKSWCDVREVLVREFQLFGTAARCRGRCVYLCKDMSATDLRNVIDNTERIFIQIVLVDEGKGPDLAIFFAHRPPNYQWHVCGQNSAYLFSAATLMTEHWLAACGWMAGD